MFYFKFYNLFSCNFRTREGSFSFYFLLGAKALIILEKYSELKPFLYICATTVISTRSIDLAMGYLHLDVVGTTRNM